MEGVRTAEHRKPAALPAAGRLVLFLVARSAPGVGMRSMLRACLPCPPAQQALPAVLLLCRLWAAHPQASQGRQADGALWAVVSLKAAPDDWLPVQRSSGMLHLPLGGTAGACWRRWILSHSRYSVCPM